MLAIHSSAAYPLQDNDSLPDLGRRTPNSSAASTAASVSRLHHHHLQQQRLDRNHLHHPHNHHNHHSLSSPSTALTVKEFFLHRRQHALHTQQLYGTSSHPHQRSLSHPHQRTITTTTTTTTTTASDFDLLSLQQHHRLHTLHLHQQQQQFEQLQHYRQQQQQQQQQQQTYHHASLHSNPATATPHIAHSSTPTATTTFTPTTSTAAPAQTAAPTALKAASALRASVPTVVASNQPSATAPQPQQQRTSQKASRPFLLPNHKRRQPNHLHLVTNTSTINKTQTASPPSSPTTTAAMTPTAKIEARMARLDSDDLAKEKIVVLLTDSLLFAMFARLSAFEGLLTVNLDGDDDSDSDDDHHAGPNGGGGGGGTAAAGTGTGGTEQPHEALLLSQHRLQTWLRMFVNQLRQGRLVQAHVVRELRQHLYSCGWSIGPQLQQMDSRLSQQQLQAIASRQEDASELFMFLTEILHLPFLPLEQRLLHGARISDDDDKVITERMLQICIPTPEEQRLRQAKEHQHQHNTQLQDPAGQLMAATTFHPPVPKTRESRLARFLNPKSNKADKVDKHHHHQSLSSSAPVTSALPPLPPRAVGPSPSDSPELEILSLEKLLAQHFYDNTLTGIRRKVSSGTGAPLSPGVEIPVSAWQVLELLPFYSSSNEQGQEVAASRRQYPGDVVILPLILKRYSFGMDGQARRISTPIEIPRRIDFSRFVNPGPERADSFSSTSAASLSSTSNEKRRLAKTLGREDAAVATTTTDHRPHHHHHDNDTDTQGSVPSYTSISEQLHEEPTSEPATPTTPTSLSLPPAATPSPLPSPSSPSSPLTVNTTRPTPTTPLRRFSLDKAGNFMARTLLESPIVPDTPPPKYTPPSTTVLSSVTGATGAAVATGDRKVWPHPLASSHPQQQQQQQQQHPDDLSIITRLSRADEGDRAANSRVRYFLELKSVVCHLGSRLDSGHYRSYVANGPPPADAYRSSQAHHCHNQQQHDHDHQQQQQQQQDAPPSSAHDDTTTTSCGTSDGGAAQSHDCEPEWLRHDDLDPSGQRVRAIAHDSDMNMEMESDWACNGYILFYELRTIRL
ncbi:hypothetical protein DFQ26_007184 [Actinomortierella ambigua]|nr:hypothetical protein DFQ26_007184 [Actinomortierella ambigua]